MADENQGTADDITAAIEYLKQHSKVPNEPPRPATPTPVTARHDLQDAAVTTLSDEDIISTMKFKHEELAHSMAPGYAAAFNDLAEYIEPLYRRTYTVAEVASFIKVSRQTVWRWLHKIDPDLVSTRRQSVNLEEITDEKALAIYIDSAYNKLRRGELTEKYNLPDKAIQALIIRGRAINDKRLKAIHKRGVT